MDKYGIEQWGDYFELHESYTLMNNKLMWHISDEFGVFKIPSIYHPQGINCPSFINDECKCMTEDIQNGG